MRVKEKNGICVRSSVLEIAISFANSQYRPLPSILSSANSLLISLSAVAMCAVPNITFTYKHDRQMHEVPKDNI